MIYSVNLERIISKLKLKTLVKAGGPVPHIRVSDLNRPGIELAGFFDHFAYERIQILGKTEITFLNKLSAALRMERWQKLLSYDIPCVVIARDLNLPQDMLDKAKECHRWILSSSKPTTIFMNRITSLLESELAPRDTLHGVLMDIYGVGVLITGESGIGKSETAIELLKRGHRLVADDVVEIKQVAEDVLVGAAPDLLQYYVEVRGLGIINARRMFGAASVRKNIKIELVIELVDWEERREIDRLGLDDEKIKFLNSFVTKNTIPVRPGRNVAAILEVAAMNHRLKSTGINAAVEFTQKLYDEINKKGTEEK